MSKPDGILAMNPENTAKSTALGSMEASYARHCQPKTEEAPSPEDRTRSKRGRQILPHQHLFSRWTPTRRAGIRPMTNAHRCPSWAALSPRQRVRKPLSPHPGETTVIQTVCVPCGSGSGSYVTSYTTSYRTSYSGSGSGSFRFGSGSCPVGGYGLS